MSQLLVITFDNAKEAGQVADTFRMLRKEGALELEDVRVIVKDEQGKVQVHDQAGHPVAAGAVAGGVLGGLLFLVAPIFGIVVGAASGAAIARSMDLDIDKKFIRDVSDALTPNSSAIFLLGSHANRSAVLNALKPYKGTLIQTTLSSEMEQQLKKALTERSE